MLDTDKRALITGEATIPYRIIINGDVDNPLTEYDILNTTYEDYRYVDADSIVVGQFVARTLKGEVKNPRSDFIIEDTEIEVQMGIKVGENTNYYSLGNFLVTKPENNDVKEITTFSAMDYTKKFNVKFDPTLISFPCTALELAQGVCEQCGVELATLNFTNSDFVVENNQYEENDSCRKVMQDIGKLAYSWVRIGWDNKCYLDFSVDDGSDIPEYNEITNYNYYDLTMKNKPFGVVNRVVVGMSNVEGENLTVQDDESIEQNGVCEIRVYDNNLTYTPELRQQVIEGARRLFGLTYLPLEMNTTGHPWLIGNELLKVVDMEGNIHYTYAFDRTIEYAGHIKTKLVSKAETTTQTQYANTNTLSKLITETKIIVDKNNKQITSVVTQTEELINKVNDNTTEINNNYQEIINKFDEIIDIDDLESYQQSMQTQMDATKLEISNIQTAIVDGVPKVKTMSGTFDENGLTMEQTGAKTKTVLDETGVDVVDVQGTGEDLLFAGYVDEERANNNEEFTQYKGQTIVYSKNMIVRNYLTIGTHSRLEDFEDGTGVFYLG